MEICHQHLISIGEEALVDALLDMLRDGIIVIKIRHSLGHRCPESWVLLDALRSVEIHCFGELAALNVVRRLVRREQHRLRIGSEASKDLYPAGNVGDRCGPWISPMSWSDVEYLSSISRADGNR
jgi:hypothetical protein